MSLFLSYPCLPTYLSSQDPASSDSSLPAVISHVRFHSVTADHLESPGPFVVFCAFPYLPVLSPYLEYHHIALLHCLCLTPSCLMFRIKSYSISSKKPYLTPLSNEMLTPWDPTVPCAPSLRSAVYSYSWFPCLLALWIWTSWMVGILACLLSCPQLLA